MRAGFGGIPQAFNHKKLIQMKKLLLIILGISLAAVANAKMVKFSVDMTDWDISPNGIHIAGDFQALAGYPGGDWQPNTTLLEKEPGTDIYSITVDIPAFRKYEYKFINGSEWYEVEFVPEESRVGYMFNDNRWIYIDSTSSDITHLPAIMFSGNAPAGYKLLRFKVDLSLEAAVNPQGVHVAGAFLPDITVPGHMVTFDQINYEYIAYIEEDTEVVEYRFLNGATIADLEVVPAECANEHGNRFVSVPEDLMLDPVCYAYCTPCSVVGFENKGETSGFRIYPNPAKGEAMIEFDGIKPVQSVSLFDQFNRLVREDILSEGVRLKLDLSKYAAGVYHVVVTYTDNTRAHSQIILQ